MDAATTSEAPRPPMDPHTVLGQVAIREQLARSADGIRAHMAEQWAFGARPVAAKSAAGTREG